MTNFCDLFNYCSLFYWRHNCLHAVMVSWSEQTDIAGLFLVFMIFFPITSVRGGGWKLEIKKIVWITRSLDKSLTPAEGQQPCAPLPYLVHWLKQQQQLRRRWMLQGPKGLAAVGHWIRNTEGRNVLLAVQSVQFIVWYIIRTAPLSWDGKLWQLGTSGV